MYARTVDEVAESLRALKSEELEDFGLATVVLVLAVAAAQFRPGLAVPLLLGGLFVGGSGMRALWRRWDLVDRLAGDRDAYVISEVRHYASIAATMERRRGYVVLIRHALRELERDQALRARIMPAAELLDALASGLENDELELEPAAAIACARLVSDVAQSPLLNAAFTAEDLSSRVRQIRTGFSSRSHDRAGDQGADR